MEISYLYLSAPRADAIPVARQPIALKQTIGVRAPPSLD